MSKAVVYIVITTVTLIFLMVNSRLTIEEKRGSLNRRFGYKILERAPNFDPLVTKIEREEEQIFINNNNNSNNNYDDDKNDDVIHRSTDLESTTLGGQLNTTLRLITLFPLLDKEPKDGFVDFKELENWIIQRALGRLDYVTQSELESKDNNGDFAVSFREYLPNLSQNDIEKREMGHGEAGWWMERFEIADSDHNGFLNFTELRDFLHPEDSQNQEMLKWIVKERLKRMDNHENDGKLNFNEFEDHIYNTYESYMDFETNGGDVPDAKDKFDELDVNKDQFLSPEELIPILPYFYPGEIAYAKYYTCYLMNEVDDNEDKKLTLQEMLNHENVFYNTVHADDHEEIDEEDDDHEEL